MTRRTKTFADNLEHFAQNLVQELISVVPGQVGLGQRIDAFKALTSYWATAEKVAAKLPVEDDTTNTVSFDKWRKAVGEQDA